MAQLRRLRQGPEVRVRYTIYLRDGAWKVDRVPYNAPGMLVWYRDTSLGNVNLTASTTYLPAELGAKGGLLIVDSHFDPFRRTGERGRQGPVDPEQPAVATAVVERGVRPRAD